MKHKGLSSHEAARLLKEHGPNAIEPPPKPGILGVFLAQFNNFLSILLLLAAVLAILIGEMVDGSLIFAIVFLNALFGVYQEKKAEAAIEALSGMTVTKVRVIRDGEEKEIDSRELVAGDVIYLEEGSKVAADSEMIEAIQLEVNEAALTGESLPVPKTVSEELFMGTIVSKGRGYARVTKIGIHTKFGEIAANLSAIEEPKTPLQKRLESLSKAIGAIGIAASAIVFFLSRADGTTLFESFLLATSLAVAVVPEGLPAVLTMTLAIGVKEMAKRKAIVRKLSSVEAFGSVTLIATDKTGTLTTNKMRVKEVYVDQKVSAVGAGSSGPKHRGYHTGGETPPLQRLLECGILCSTASLVPIKDHGSFDILGDPTEGAALILAAEMGVQPDHIREEWKTIDEMPFDSVTKRMWVLVQRQGVTNEPYHHSRGSGNPRIDPRLRGDDKMLYAKGAPESILSISNSILIGDKEETLTPERKKHIETAFEDWAKKGLRVLAFAYEQSGSSPHHSRGSGNLSGDPRFRGDDKMTHDLTFIGMVGIHDAPRPEVPDAIRKAHDAGIKVVMITGDNEITAAAIASHVGLMREGDEILNGSQVESYSDQQLLEKLDKVRIFARTTPFHKQRIVSLFQKKGEVVAVTGDGVNDSIALKQADVGIAMGMIGTDVARETADIVIADDNFATIVNGIEEGRNIIKNVKNAIIYLLSCNIAEAMALIGGLLLGLPPLFLPIQLLYVNLVTDGFPALALAYSPKEERLMKEPPKRALSLLQKPEYIRIFGQGAMATIFVFVAYYWFRSMTTSTDAMHQLGSTAAFTTLALIQSFIFADIWLEHRTPFTSYRRTRNPIFWAAFAIPFIAQAAVIYVPFLARLFKVYTLSIGNFFMLIVLSALVMVGLRFIHKGKRISGG